MQSQRQAGFTLLEVMLVMVLMGLTAAAVTLSFRQASIDEELNKQAKKFIAASELVLEETVLSGRLLGLVIEPDSYRFVIYEEQKWLPMQTDRLLAEHVMDYGIKLEVIVDGLPLEQSDEEDESWFDEPLIEKTEEEKKKYPDPQIMLFPSGELSPFELRFIGEDEFGDQFEALVVGDALGRITLGRPDEE